jgi:S-formylglutathione hydrolase FrmB
VNISIVSGWLPIVVECVAVAVLACAIDWRGGRWQRQLGIGVPVAVLVSAVTGAVLWLASLVSGGTPWWPLAWGALLVLAVVVAVLGWSATGRVRRIASVAAVVLMAAATLSAVNVRTSTFPTLGRLMTDEPEHVVDLPGIVALRAEVARTGVLPKDGVVVTVTIPPKISHFTTRPAYVYLPPAWFARSTPKLPTLVLLPGEPGSAADWSQAGNADTTADAFAGQHDGLAPIIVMPDPDGFLTDDSECVNSAFGNAETYLVTDVPAFARTDLDASDAPGSLAIGGLSAGGTCSVVLALVHPTVYPTFASFSGFLAPQYHETDLADTVRILFGGSTEAFDRHDPLRLLAGADYHGSAGWFEVGDDDADPLAAAHQLQPAAARAGVATCIRVRPGGHDFDVWSRALSDAFPWLSWRLGLTAEPEHEPATCVSP